MSYEWFNYPYASPLEKDTFLNINGINAGTFAFKDLSFLDVVNKHCSKYDFSNQNQIDQAMFEQSSFNYTVYQMSDRKIKDISKIVKLHAKEVLCDGVTIYHFCGYEGYMDSKFNRMNILNKKYLKK
jgi:hypothetical protein